MSRLIHRLLYWWRYTVLRRPRPIRRRLTPGLFDEALKRAYRRDRLP